MTSYVKVPTSMPDSLYERSTSTRQPIQETRPASAGVIRTLEQSIYRLLGGHRISYPFQCRPMTIPTSPGVTLHAYLPVEPGGGQYAYLVILMRETTGTPDYVTITTAVGKTIWGFSAGSYQRYMSTPDLAPYMEIVKVGSSDKGISPQGGDYQVTLTSGSGNVTLLGWGLIPVDAESIEVG